MVLEIHPGFGFSNSTNPSILAIKFDKIAHFAAVLFLLLT